MLALSLLDLTDDLLRVIVDPKRDVLSSREVASLACTCVRLAALFPRSSFRRVTLGEAALANFRLGPALRGGACERLTLAPTTDTYLAELVDYAVAHPEHVRRLTHVAVVAKKMVYSRYDIERVLGIGEDAAVFPALRSLHVTGCSMNSASWRFSDFSADPRFSCDAMVLSIDDVMRVPTTAGTDRRFADVMLRAMHSHADQLFHVIRGFRAQTVGIIVEDLHLLDPPTCERVAIGVARMAEHGLHMKSDGSRRVFSMQPFLSTFLRHSVVTTLRLPHVSGLFATLCEGLGFRPLESLAVVFGSSASTDQTADAVSVESDSRSLRELLSGRVRAFEVHVVNLYNTEAVCPMLEATFACPTLDLASFSLVMPVYYLRILTCIAFPLRTLSIHVCRFLSDDDPYEEVDVWAEAVASMCALESVEVKMPSFDKRTRLLVLRAFMDRVLRLSPPDSRLRTIRTPGVCLEGDGDILTPPKTSFRRAGAACKKPAR